MTQAPLRLADFPAPPVVQEATFARLPFAHVTPMLRAGRFRFRVRASDAAVGAHVQRLLAGFPVSRARAPHTTYSVISGVNGWPGWWAGYADDQRISNAAHPSVTLTHVFAHLNRAVVAHSPEHVVNLHASAAALDGRAVVMAGPTESGKSTLVAALGLRGLAYLTDEVVAVDGNTLTVAPYPKPPSIDPGAWSVLAALRPAAAETIPGIGHSQWHVDPAVLPGGVAGAPAPVALLLRTRWRAGTRTRLRPTSRARFVTDLALDMFRPRDRLVWQVQVLGRLAERAPVYDLSYGDVHDAAARIRDVLANRRTF